MAVRTSEVGKTLMPLKCGSEMLYGNWALKIMDFFLYNLKQQKIAT
jgi:hypothetical protein